MDQGTSPARMYALVVGAVLVIAGIVGFFYNGDFNSEGTRDSVFGVLDVNGWHNVVHLLTGALGLLAVGYAARAYALILGIVYLVVAVWGFLIYEGGALIISEKGAILEIVPVNTADNVLHLALGALGIIAYLATPASTTSGAPGASGPPQAAS